MVGPVYRCDDCIVLNAALESAENLGFVSGYRFSDTVSRSKSDAPLGAGSEQMTFSAVCFAAEVAPRREDRLLSILFGR
jgi:hypothetical protein